MSRSQNLDNLEGYVLQYSRDASGESGRIRGLRTAASPIIFEGTVDAIDHDQI